MPLHLLDWAICFVYVAAVVALGVWSSRRQVSNEEYFVGGRRMNWWAIGLSLFATSFSALSFVGLPREAAYQNYHLYLAILLIPIWVTPIVAYLFIPTFHRLRLTSAYEYLERRFSRRVRLIGSLLYTLSALVWMGSMLYAVGIIVQVVLGLDETQLIWAIVILGLFTTLYTVIGGFEAVIWTDVMQGVTLGVGMLIVLIIALASIDGGWSTVWETGLEHGKFDMFHLEFDPTAVPGSLFSVMALGMFSFLAIYGTEQPVVQRYVSMPSVSAARRAVFLNAVVLAGVGLLFFTVGTTIFAFYQQSPPANPLASGLPHLPKEDQLVTHFILTEIPFPGLIGFLLAGLFAAAMSSVDSGINSLTALVVCDWMSGRTLKLGVSRLCCGLFGVAVILTALVAPRLGANVYSIITKIEGTLVGPLLGIFLLGLLVPRTNAPGALAGVVVGIAVALFLSLTDLLSFWWYAAATCLPTIAVGVLASLVFPPPTDSKLNGLLAFPKS